MALENSLFQNLFAGFVSLALALLAWMLRTIFSRITTDLEKFERKIDSVQIELRANTIATAETRSEIRAVWRFVDNTHDYSTSANGKY